VTFRLFIAAALAAVLLGAVPRPTQLIVYSAPAGDRPAGADSIHPADGVLPDGRLIAPAGKTTFVGTNPLGFALSADGRFAVVSNDDQRTGGLSIPPSEPPLAIGYSLSVVDTATMNVISVFHDPAVTFFLGIAAVPNPRDPSTSLVFASDGANGVVRIFDLDSTGQLTMEPQTIAIAGRGNGKSFPAGIAAAPDGSAIYVVDNLGGTLTAIDVASRRVARQVPVGDFPLVAAADAGRVLVSNGGLGAYAELSRPAHAPPFGEPPFDPDRASSLSVFTLNPDRGQFAVDTGIAHLDPAPDGTANVGGAGAGSIVLSPDGKQAYVALANVDRVAVVDLEGSPEVVRGLDLRLFPDAPFGAQPSAQAIGSAGKRLYVALAGLNAVAILDAKTPKKYRYGLIPTGWLPVALALSPKDNGRFLYILNAKGIDGFGVLQKIDLKHPDLVRWTLDSLRFNRATSAAKPNLTIPPLRSGARSDVVDHVVYISFGSQTFDAMLGDLKDATGGQHGNGEPSLNIYPENVTPNLHKLARSYGLADNFYASDLNADIARQFALGGQASLYTQLLANVSVARSPLAEHGEDPEDYVRAGSLFNQFARAGMGFRDYGGLMNVTGYRDGNYALNVPAAAALNANVDLDYVLDPAKTDDTNRAREFMRDLDRYAQADQMPSFVYLSLPTSTGKPGSVAEADRALGSIIRYLSQTTHWSSTAVFVVPAGTDGGTDHVNAARSYALVVSPLARRGYVGHAHLSPPSVVKTTEEIFGFGALTLGDLLSTDMADFFLDVPQPEQYEPVQ
jgi:YVTN family beta-propeller protein